MSLSIASSSSFKVPFGAAQNRSFIMKNNNDKAMNYYYKFIKQDVNVIIKTPQEIIPDITGDKQVHFRFITIADPQFSEVGVNLDIFSSVRMSIMNQRNNYNENGVQTQIIGYLQFDKNLGYMKGECQPFEMDGRLDVKLIFEKLDVATNTWNNLTLSNYVTGKRPYIYIDCEIQYDLSDF